MTIIPPYLKPGDTIGLVCPAGCMASKDFSTSIDILKEWGFNIEVGNTPGHSHHYFAGTDEERLADLQQMMDNPEIDAILCARGGYGTARIIDDLNFEKLAQKPKWIIGFSDITVLHCHLLSNYNIASLHAPMSAAFNDGEHANEFIRSLHDALLGKKADYRVAGHSFNQPGEATGILAGGNLSLLVDMIATPSEFDYAGKLLFMEDVGEYIYSIDKMVRHLHRAGRLSSVRGIIVGGFTESKDTTIPFGQTAEEAIRDILKEYQIPVCFHFPVSHDKENYALKTGVEYTLNVSQTDVRLREV